MQKKNRIIWLYTLEFLARFRSLSYDNVPLHLLLLRDFQKYIRNRYSFYRPKMEKNRLQTSIQAACDPYLLQSTPQRKEKGFTLIRAHLNALTIGIDQPFLYLAHRKKEYRMLSKVRTCRPLIYIHDLAAHPLHVQEKNRVHHEIDRIIASEQTPNFFQEKHFVSWLQTKINKTLKLIAQTHTLFNHYEIRRTVYGSTINRYGALITTFAQSRNIPTVNLQHGMLGEVGHLPLNADRYYVWGPSHRDYYLSHGGPSQKIKIIAPFCSQSLSLANDSAHQSHIQTFPSSTATTHINITVALQPLGKKFNRQMIKRIEKASQPFAQKVRITYKLHPDQGQGRYYRRFLTHPYSKLVPHQQASVHECIRDSTFIITPYSTVAYEALLAQKPVLFYGRTVPIYYVKKQPKFVKRARDIQSILSRIIKKPSYLRTLYQKNELKDPLPSNTNLQSIHQQLWRSITQDEHEPPAP